METTVASRKVESWLRQEGYELGERPDTEYSGFFLVGRSGRRAQPISITQRVGEDKWTLTAGVRLNEPDIGAMGDVSPVGKLALKRDLTWLLASRGFLYDLDEQGQSLQGLTFSCQIFEDGLTKDRLMSSLLQLTGCCTLVGMRIREALSASPAPKITPSPQPVQPPTCAQCSAALRPGARFCGTCGKPVVIVAPVR